VTTPEAADRVLRQAIARIARPDYPAWALQLAAAGNCSHPVRLTGRSTRVDGSTGEVQLQFTTATQPDRVLLKACGTRRATRCPACAAVYRSDARALILAGLRGGKGVSADVTEYPLVFVTLTAPSFGAVHTTRADGGACQPGTQSSRCPHHRPRNCFDRHERGDPMAGQPLCPRCYDQAGTVIWNARAAELWRRTTIALRRRLASTAGLTVRQLDKGQAAAFVKVAEYQERGVVHFHALIRLDPTGAVQPINSETLAGAIYETVPRVRIANPHQPERPIQWGQQTDVTIVPAGERSSVAAYLAKYATKSVDTGGALDHRLHHGDLTNYPLPDHLRTLAETAWNLGGDTTLAGLNLRHWAHTLGYRGHWLTKSRGWSTTLTQLRTDRHLWQLARHGHTPTAESPEVIVEADWTYNGTGHHSDGDTWLAAITHANRQQQRRTAWEER
jgi:hypothetical protein